MASTGMSTCCLSGHLHNGTPSGREEQIGGLDTYVSEPKDGSKAKSLVFITDIFGWKVPNVRLLADEYAKAGLYCYIPDLFHGDSLPMSFLQNVEPPMQEREKLSTVDKAKNTAIVGTTLGPWLIKHREGLVKPLIDGFVNTIRVVPGTEKVGAIGFCWGARYAILESHGPQENAEGAKIGGVDAAYGCHPSLLSIPGDLEGVSRPLALAVGGEDSLLDQASVGKIMDVLGKKVDMPHEIRIYENQIHGFALRGDWSNENEKKAMDEAVQQGVDWFNKYLS